MDTDGIEQQASLETDNGIFLFFGNGGRFGFVPVLGSGGILGRFSQVPMSKVFSTLESLISFT